MEVIRIKVNVCAELTLGRAVVMGGTVSPQQGHVGALTPGTSECDLIWRQSLYKGIQVKMRSSGWALIQRDWCPYKKGKLGQRQTCTQCTQGERHVTQELCCPEPRNHQQPGERLGTES